MLPAVAAFSGLIITTGGRIRFTVHSFTTAASLNRWAFSSSVMTVDSFLSHAFESYVGTSANGMWVLSARIYRFVYKKFHILFNQLVQRRNNKHRMTMTMTVSPKNPVYYRLHFFPEDNMVFLMSNTSSVESVFNETKTNLLECSFQIRMCTVLVEISKKYVVYKTFSNSGMSMYFVIFKWMTRFCVYKNCTAAFLRIGLF